MYTFEETISKVEAAVNKLEYPYSPGSLYEPIRYILSLGGKRIRPVLAVLGCNIFSETVENAIQPALALEVFHNFTLLHDDLMDQADIRRGKPTVHKKWNPNSAILSGDAMLIVAYRLITETPGENALLYTKLFSDMALEICGGQQYDMEFESRTDVTEEEYLEMIRLKTAVLLGTALKIGALSGGATPEQANLLYEYGINIGLAFQLKDDLLDTYGDTSTFGKNIGGDILCNKKTYLLINALQAASTSRYNELMNWINKVTFKPEEKIEAVKAIYNELKIGALCESKIDSYYQKAQEILQSPLLPQERLHVLIEVSNKLMFRES